MKNPATKLLQVLDYQDTLSMTSLEISELTNSRHDNVKRSIERLSNNGVIQLPPLEVCVRINDLGLEQDTSHYIFTGSKGKRDTLVVIARLSPEMEANTVISRRVCS